MRRPMGGIVGLMVVVMATLLNDLPAQETKKQPPAIVNKEDEPGKLRGQLPKGWGKIGLSDEQKQAIYRIQNKYNAEIERLQAKINELKTARDKEMRDILTPEQRKRLEQYLLKEIK